MRKLHGMTFVDVLVIISIALVVLLLLLPFSKTDPLPLISKNSVGQTVEVTDIQPVEWAIKHPYARVITLSEKFGGQYRLTVVYEEVQPNAEK